MNVVVATTKTGDSTPSDPRKVGQQLLHISHIVQEKMSEYNARIPASESTRDDLKVLVVKSDSANYDELLADLVEQHPIDA